MTATRLAEIEAAHGKATPGEWRIVEYGDEDCPNLVVHSTGESRVCFMATVGSHGDPAKIEADAASIALLHNEFPAVATALREAWAKMAAKDEEIATLKALHVEAKVIARGSVAQIEEAQDSLVAYGAEIERLRAAGDAMAEATESPELGTKCVICYPEMSNDDEHTPDCPVAAWNAAKGGK